MCKLFIFGGTTEGRLLAEFCAREHIEAYVSVVSEYGSELLPKSDYIHILTKRLDSSGMAVVFRKYSISRVVDATHPYAVEVSKNIAEVCEMMKISRFRVIRDRNQICKSAVYFDTAAQAADYLNTVSGNVLITTGSKELTEFCTVKNYAERCAVRILDSPKAFDKCTSMGFVNIISEKGPFSQEQNIRHIKQYFADYLVTKESGAAGGFDEKISAAEICGAVLLIIRRPVEVGITLEQMKEILLSEQRNG